MATISLHHVKDCLHGIRERGLNERALLTHAGINPAVLDETEGRVHTEQVARLFRLVQQTLEDEFLGFTAHPCKWGAFALLSEWICHSKNLREMLEKSFRFYNLLTDDVSFWVKEEVSEESSSNALIGFTLKDPKLDVYHFLTEYLLVTWHRFSSWYIGEAIHLRETHFVHSPPAHRQELQIMFPGVLRFNQSVNTLVFDAQYLEKPLVRSERELQTYLENMPVDLMTIPGEDNTLEGLIERTLYSASGDRLIFPRATELAQQLQLSPQMLYRRLIQEGTSYAKIKDNIRREVSIDRLVNGKLSVEAISDIVGFAEPRSFTRAFKQWTGLSPRGYCKIHAGKP